MMNLQDHIIVVTGGEGLLGRALVSCCKQAGATVLSADVAGGDIHLDISDEESVVSCVQTVVANHGRIDGWVNNAYPRTEDWGLRFEEIPFKSWQQNMNMHLGGYFLCCQQVLEQMKKQGKGSLVNIASIYGVTAPDFSLYEGTTMTSPAAYAAIKGGLITLTKYLASYYGAHQVRVNAVSPGGIEDGQPTEFIKKYNAKTPLGRMATPADIAPAVAFLLSDSAGYITGQNIVVDGGFTTR